MTYEDKEAYRWYLEYINNLDTGERAFRHDPDLRDKGAYSGK